jgi:serine/threonine-protein kinase PknK
MREFSMLNVVFALLTAQSAPESLTAHTAVRIGDQVVVTGEPWGTRRGDNWLYSLKNKSWKKAAPIPVQRWFATAVAWKGKALVFGGMDADGNHSNRIDAYDPKLNQWIVFGRLPESISRAAALVSRGKLLVSGGYNGSNDRQAQNSSALLQYDEATRTWQALPPMATARHGHCLVEFQNRIWAIGGAGNDLQGVCESYDPALRKWRKEAAFSGSRIFFGASVFGGKLVAFGSIEGNAHSLEWTPGGWRDRTSVELPRRWFAFVRDGEKVIVFGGEPDGPFVVEYRP